MRMNVHLNFQGNCAEAFAFYKELFRAPGAFQVRYSDAPVDMPIDPSWKDKVMHTSIPIGNTLLMGCDAPPGRSTPLGGFQVCIEDTDSAEVARLFDGLQQGGSIQMPLQPTFWSPLFGMCTDRFGIAWMIGLPSGEA